MDRSKTKLTSCLAGASFADENSHIVVANEVNDSILA